MMLKEIKTVGATDAVVRQLVELIKTGYFKPNQKLPNEMEFMEMLNVGRSTIREAKRSLASMNLIESHPGRGSFVREVSTLSLINEEMFGLIINDEEEMLHEARIILETQMALLAVKRATVEDIERMQRCVDKLAEAIERHTEIYELGNLFHRALSESSHNRVLIKLSDMLGELLSKIQRPTYEQKYDQNKEVSVHQNIVDAIRERDQWKTIEAMERHFDYVSEVAKKT
ncbi:FadR/GntR family transcriptional regulator [Paenibacillus solisilvae]|uniref:FadR/GntR family transcriptional regulator n=1 Tax=Paenibacillus solisilvae TaxID=2486751 RepID=A0ABW0VPN2_9BACL